ncbi:ABC transporter ATP-binding protein [Lentzea rhizosphaerae]|uniref:ABC transporter ATP-binding protein n=1 Tax=Lentzea rhizosphaerae TaxID=2041025 RepID=A0ABV8BPI8_9PSEU
MFLLRPVRGRLFLGICCQALAAVAGVAPFIAVAEVGRVLLSGGPWWQHVMLGALALPVRVALLTAATTLTHLADNDLQLHLRRRLAAHLGRLPLGWFSGRGSGAVKRAVHDDVGALHHLVAHSLLDLVTAVVVPVVATLYLFTIDPLMTLITLLPLGAGLLLHARAMRDVTARMAEYHQATQRLDNAVVEFVHGITVVKAFGQTGKAHKRFSDAAREYGAFVTGWAEQVTPSLTRSQLAQAPLVALLVVLTAGTTLIGTGLLTTVDLIPFVVLGIGLSAPALAISYSVQDVRAGRAALGRIEELLATPPLPEPAHAPELPFGPARVELDSVRFGYDDETEVLHGIDVVLEPGTVTALVGPSGSGKSTLAALVARFHDVTAGAVRINGVDLRNLPGAELYRWVGFVLQDVRLLRTTVLDNIRLARPDADLDEVVRVARAARIHDRITELSDGYLTVLGDDVRLSGGEAQRVSIARALLADTPVLVLDEATAFADAESEAAIQDAISELARGRTVLVIAHRLSTVVDADQIVVLDEGVVVEKGRHDELVAAGGRYAALWAVHA